MLEKKHRDHAFGWVRVVGKPALEGIPENVLPRPPAGSRALDQDILVRLF